MPNPENAHQPRTRQRAALSCTQCRKRKQKCNQAKDRPCNHCARRYPPVECVYEGDGGGGMRSDSRSREKLIGTNSGGHDRQGIFQTTAELINRKTLPIRAPLPPRFMPTSSYPKEAHKIRELSPATRERLQSHPGSSYDISRIFLVDVPRPETEYFSQSDAARYVVDLAPTQQIGASFMDSLNHLPVDVTRRNAELLHFFVQRLSPFMSSIDGTNPSPDFTSQWIKVMVGSPLVVYLSILSAAYFQATARRIDVEKSVDTMAARMRLIRLINEHISTRAREGRGVSDEAVVAVTSLSYNELIYSDKKSVLAHMTGLRSMVKTRGGLENIHIGDLRKLVAGTDYQVACTYEIEPFLHPPRSDPIPVIKSYPINLDSPLLHSHIRFSDSREALGIGSETAGFLDDMRFLTTAIHVLASTPGGSKEKTEKFLKTVQWISNRLISKPIAPASNDFLHATIHTASLIYTSSILSHTPLSLSCTPALLQEIWKTMWRVPLPRWKKIPGIFLWVLLVVNPFVAERMEGRFVKGMIAASIIGIGVVDWDVTIAILTGFVKVQLWLGDAEEDARFKRGNEMVEREEDDPDWALKESS